MLVYCFKRNKSAYIAFMRNKVSPIYKRTWFWRIYFHLGKKFNPKRTSFLNIFLKFIGLIYQFLKQKRIISRLVWRLVRGRLDQDFSVTCSYIGKYRKKRAITENSTTLLLARSCFSNSRLFCSQIAFVVWWIIENSFWTLLETILRKLSFVL